MLIPTVPLIAARSFGRELPAPLVAAALAGGLRAGGAAEPDVFAIGEPCGRGGDPRAALVQAHFDERMRRASAVIICERALSEATLAGSLAFEMASRARQSGVPAFAVTAQNDLSSFDARILDLQRILTARSARELAAAGRRLAREL